MKKVIVDTDIGSDIDDALAITYLLCEPRCKLMGVTTVTGEAEKRAGLASVLCQAFGIEIPIFPGIEESIGGGQIQPKAQQAEILNDYPHKAQFPKNGAVNFLAKTIRDNPHEITLLAIGPLTNIATLFRENPDIPDLLRELVMMSGIFSADVRSFEKWSIPEWNTRVDPLAAKEIYDACPKANKIIGLDTTAQVFMKAEKVRETLFPLLPKIVAEMMEIWFRERTHVTFHDPLAAVAIFNEKMCEFKRVRVEIDLADPKMLGMTKIDGDAAEKKHNISVAVDPRVFFDAYFSTIGEKGEM